VTDLDLPVAKEPPVARARVGVGVSWACQPLVAGIATLGYDSDSSFKFWISGWSEYFYEVVII
jgi:hypothetical protein